MIQIASFNGFAADRLERVQGVHVDGFCVVPIPKGSMSTVSREPRRVVRIHEIQAMKERGERITALTAYDFLFARLVDRAGVDIVLVGDTLGEVVLGFDSTLPVTLDDMIHHACAVRRGVERALIVVDLPFLTYQVSIEEAVRNAGRVLKETGAAAVKIEGGSPNIARTIAALVEVGIPVMGHIGFTPQSIHALGGFRVQGRETAEGERLRTEARNIEEAGAFSIVLELVPGALAADITRSAGIPTIGIGAGPDCDGQVLVLHDMLGLNPGFEPRFLRRFADLGTAADTGIRQYVSDVKEGVFPSRDNTF